MPDRGPGGGGGGVLLVLFLVGMKRKFDPYVRYSSVRPSTFAAGVLLIGSMIIVARLSSNVR